MQIPQSIAGMSSRWSKSDLRSAEGKNFASKAEALRDDQHVQFSQEAKQALKQGKVEDGSLAAGSADAYPEVAICPECGSANCGCLARLEAQRKLDELRAGRSTQRVNEINSMERVA